ncbi:hypothetical protein FZC35_01160 [Candidatus Cytomitobacter indipagum]|uniref:WH2 domain-containing protein n=1 Tax=Candidatus Cytomitobacter indipagum TaxID=2601575 RepID=A0A5C0UDD0_9PROT|nr:WH2 domain-containing protein [Candidatus Cytomitobacter indipagum]QEK37988.1 hypothetical protein FZC35_01160 [Candidatus Cytomitobacter indipagum]
MKYIYLSIAALLISNTYADAKEVNMSIVEGKPVHTEIKKSDDKSFKKTKRKSRKKVTSKSRRKSAAKSRRKSAAKRRKVTSKSRRAAKRRISRSRKPVFRRSATRSGRRIARRSFRPTSRSSASSAKTKSATVSYYDQLSKDYDKNMTDLRSMNAEKMALTTKLTNNTKLTAKEKVELENRLFVVESKIKSTQFATNKAKNILENSSAFLIEEHSKRSAIEQNASQEMNEIERSAKGSINAPSLNSPKKTADNSTNVDDDYFSIPKIAGDNSTNAALQTSVSETGAIPDAPALPKEGIKGLSKATSGNSTKASFLIELEEKGREKRKALDLAAEKRADKLSMGEIAFDETPASETGAIPTPPLVPKTGAIPTPPPAPKTGAIPDAPALPKEGIKGLSKATSGNSTKASFLIELEEKGREKRKALDLAAEKRADKLSMGEIAFDETPASETGAIPTPPPAPKTGAIPDAPALPKEGIKGLSKASMPLSEDQDSRADLFAEIRKGNFKLKKAKETKSEFEEKMRKALIRQRMMSGNYKDSDENDI